MAEIDRRPPRWPRGWGTGPAPVAPRSVTLASRICAAVLSGSALLISSSSPADEPKPATKVVYANHFDGKVGSSFPEWTSSRIAYSSRFTPPGTGSIEAPADRTAESPRGRRRFLGEFGGPRVDPTARTRVRQAVWLTLGDLPPHSEASVAFDLLVLKSWDGNSPQFGPDRWTLKVRGGPTLLDTTFSNNFKTDTERTFQDYPRKRSRPRTGAAAAGTLGYDFFGDSVYHLSFTFPHEADTLVVEFSGDLFEGKGTADESWGLDDVQVTVKARPGPGSQADAKNGAARPRP
jgi:hypothetical protein